MRIEPATDAAIQEAARLLRAGRVVGMPTETVYGLAADAGSAAGVAEIYRVKGRPADHPLIVHTVDAAGARAWAAFDHRAQALADAFWPGPLTLILTRRPEMPAHAGAGEETIGLRVPAHPVARRLLAAFSALGGQGIAAPSANRFGRVSPTRASHVQADLGDDIPLVLDGGDAQVGLESTIVDLSRGVPVLMRPGGIAASAIEAVLGEPLRARDARAPRASGTLAAHYAPATPLELVDATQLPARVAEHVALGRRVLTWSRAPVPPAQWCPAPADPDAFGHELYDRLRRLDACGVDRLLVESPPSTPAWAAVLDRLSRAAATFQDSPP